MAVTMKQDYAASEVYSTTSEAPPAYKIRQANSVKIAKIAAVTIILASCILGSFMLASTYLQAKQSCDQMQTLDAVLNKELMLEAMQQELPKAAALMQDQLSADEASLQTVEEKPKKKATEPEKKESSAENHDEDEDDEGESDESADMNNANRVHIKLPLDLDLSELAHAMFRENHKSKMNCVVERRRSEEMVDSPIKTMRLPFGMAFNTEPKQQKVTGERIAIFCETGNEPKNEEAEPVRQVLIPIPPIRSFGPITHLPQQMPPQQMIRQMPRPIFPMQMLNHAQQIPPMPAQMMQAPHPEMSMMRPSFHAHPQPMLPQQQPQQQPQQPQQPQQLTFPQQMQPPRAEVRIQFQRIPIPEAIRPFLPPQLMRNGQEQPEGLQVREVPLEMALQKVGLSADELKDIHEIAAQKFTEQLKQLIGEMSDSEESEEETDSYRTTPAQEPASQHSEERELQEQQPPRVQEPEPQPQHPAEGQILPMGRAQYARSLITPIDLPGKVIETSVSDEEAERPHYVQPRSV